MLQCFWCGWWFRNKQALRAHLKHCKERIPGGEFRYGPYAQPKSRAEKGPEQPKREGVSTDLYERFRQLEEMRKLVEELLKKRARP